ncbi:MAG: hypothetical protein EAZ76_05675 [Nostocales cyanobacterium]|nr:MAG: hypothetical protein EAZ87_08370 [Nostocales cyanobacterium]TAF17819.1 MAG: hypothetical protein EAZ76_05675 [Nostocales cyanobacterium]
MTLFPKTRQPNPGNGNVRWIQWVRSNHSLLTNKHDDQESVIDIDTKNYNGTSYFSDPGTPFYYSKISSQQTNPVYKFEDLPNRVDIGQNHDWIADLYLAEEITKPGSNVRKVLIYGGVRWGWHNRVVEKKKEPNPNIVPGLCPANNSSGECPPPPSCNGSSGGGGCNKNVISDQNQYEEMSAFDQNDINSLLYQSVSFIDFDYTNWLTQEEYQLYFGMDDAPWWIENYELSEDDINDPTWWTLEDDRLYFSEYYGGNNSESPTSVPESTSTFGLLLLSAFVFIKSLTITKD